VFSSPTGAVRPGVVALTPRVARAQPKPAEPPERDHHAAADFGPNAPPNVYFVGPDVSRSTRRSTASARSTAPESKRLWTGALWSEGPRGCGQAATSSGATSQHRQMRWLEDDGRVSGVPHAVEQQQRQHVRLTGRQLSCEHLTRRFWCVTTTRLDHPDRGTATRASGSIRPTTSCRIPTLVWIHATRRTAASSRGRAPGRAGAARSNTAGGSASARPRAGHGQYKRELSDRGVIASTPAGKVDLVVTEAQVTDPNGLCFSPDYKKLLRDQHGPGPGDTGTGAKGDMHVFDVGSDNKLSSGKLFSDFMNRRREVRTGWRARRRGGQPLVLPATRGARSATAA